MEKSKVLVMLDMGHGCNTPGKSSPVFDDGKTQLKEYAYVRAIGYEVYNKLISEGYRCYIVHPEVEEITSQSYDLNLRVQRANKKYLEERAKGNKAIFISIHVNAAGNGSWMNAQGWSVYTSKGQTSADKLATCIYEVAESKLKPLGKKLRPDNSDGDPDQEANYYVLSKTACPACLTENMFMDNKEDATWLLSNEGRNIITDIHVEGIKKYIASL